MRTFIILVAACFIGSTSLFAQQSDTLKRKQNNDGTVSPNTFVTKSNQTNIADDGTVLVKKINVNAGTLPVHDTITINGKRAVEFEDGTWKYLEENKVINK